VIVGKIGFVSNLLLAIFISFQLVLSGLRGFSGEQSCGGTGSVVFVLFLENRASVGQVLSCLYCFWSTKLWWDRFSQVCTVSGAQSCGGTGSVAFVLFLEHKAVVGQVLSRLCCFFCHSFHHLPISLLTKSSTLNKLSISERHSKHHIKKVRKPRMKHRVK
jgi:hypothetical protein